MIKVSNKVWASISIVSSFIAGAIVGSRVEKAVLKPKYCGCLEYNKADKTLYLKLEKAVDEVCSNEYTIFKVNVVNVPSHK